MQNVRRIVILCLALATIFVLVRPATATQRPALLARQAAFEWFQKPAAVRFTKLYDRTYACWVTQDGKIQIRYFDNRNGSWSATTTIDDLKSDFGIEAQDDHNAPSLLILPTGKILIFYTVHDVMDNLFVRESISPEDPTQWSTRRKVLTDGVHSTANYPQPKLLPNGRIALFIRFGAWNNATEAMTTSADQGRTWSSPQLLVNFGFGTGIYAFIALRGNTLAMTWSERKKSGQPTNLYYAMSTDGGTTWRKSNGRRLTLPITIDQVEIVVKSLEPLYAWDVVIDVNLQPRIVFTIGNESHNRFGYTFRRNGSWRTETITTSTLLYGGSSFYSGGIVIDPTDPNRVVLSKKRKTLELETWHRTASGWKRESSITTNSGVDNFRPQFVAGDKGNRVVWSAGHYDGLLNGDWTGFDRVNILTVNTK